MAVLQADERVFKSKVTGEPPPNHWTESCDSTWDRLMELTAWPHIFMLVRG